jgi:hypothetical protein
MESDILEQPNPKLASFVKKHASHTKCECPIVKTASGYYKKHHCIEGKKRCIRQQ